METIGDRVAIIFKASGLTEKEFALKIGRSYHFASLLASGRSAPSDRTISDICWAFEVNENWLRTGKGEVFSPVPGNESEIFSILENALAVKTPEFRRRLAVALSHLNASDLELLGQSVLRMGSQRNVEASAEYGDTAAPDQGPATGSGTLE